MSRPDIEAFANDFRTAIEACWGPDTGMYSSDLFPAGYEIPPSAGQCVATSGLLLEDIRAEYPGERFRFNTGAVYLGTVAVLSHHNFITHHRLIGRPPRVLDITADQAPGITNRVVYGDIQGLAARGLVYLVFDSYDEVPEFICEDVIPEPPIRTRMNTLRQRMRD